MAHKVLHSLCPKGAGHLTVSSKGKQEVSLQFPTNFQVLFYIMAFKATFVNATDPLMQLSMSIWWHLGFIWQKKKKKKKSKGETKNIYTHFIYKLKNLVQMSCYI